jgi:murein DD-endopeptidase
LPSTSQVSPDPCETVSRLGEVAPISTPPMTLNSGQAQTSPAPPVRSLFVTSPYNLNRRHPVSGRIRPHYGTDFRAPINEPIFAALDGVATLRTNNEPIFAALDGVATLRTNGGGPTKGYGYYIFIRHTAYSTLPNMSPEPFFTLYAHLQDYNRRPVIRNGQKVKRGQLIGYSGGSGIGNGAHLHFEYITNSSTPFNAGSKKDPMAHFIGKTFYQSQE